MSRERLPQTREAITHKFSISGHEGYLNVGKYPDGRPGEIFITMNKEGSTISGLMDGVATLTSIALQSGVPLKSMVSKFAYTKFEPSGFTGNDEVKDATSILDYIFRWLAVKFMTEEEREEAGLHTHPTDEQKELEKML